MKYKNVVIFLALLGILTVTTANLGLNIYLDERVKSKLKSYFFPVELQKPPERNFTGRESDKIWSKKILDGGYILFMRHTHRDKDWKGSGTYELLEVHVHGDKKNNLYDGEKRSYSGAVCLSEKGVIQAEAMSDLIKHVNLPIGKIYSSPVCRARQTAEIVFGRSDELDPVLVYSGLNYETSNDRFSNLKRFFNTVPVSKDKNTVITAHGNVIVEGLFSNPSASNLKIDEGGIIVLSRRDGEIVIEHSFHIFKSFVRPFFERK